MAKTITYQMHYDAPVADVAAMLADPAFREEVCRMQRVSRVEVTVVPQADGGKEVTIDQWQPTQGMPSFAKKIVGEETNIVQRERWTSQTHGDIEVTIPGKPGEMSGTADLAEVDGATVESVEMTVKVKVPLVAGKLEGLIADLLLKALKAEHQAGKAYLAR